MDMLETDGPYEGAACLKTSRDRSHDFNNTHVSQVMSDWRDRKDHNHHERRR
jgi:hypothetical protein